MSAANCGVDTLEYLSYAREGVSPNLTRILQCLLLFIALASDFPPIQRPAAAAAAAARDQTTRYNITHTQQQYL